MKVMLDENAKMPTKAHDLDAGFDLYATKDFEVPAGTTKERLVCEYSDGYFYEYGESPDHDHEENESCVWVNKMFCCEGSAIHDTGVHIEIPRGYVGFIKSKSGLNVKHGITAEGVIDAGYTGSIVVKLYNHTLKPYKFNKGDKITQLVILPIGMFNLEQVSSLDGSARGDSGFGSSGK